MKASVNCLASDWSFPNYLWPTPAAQHGMHKVCMLNFFSADDQHRVEVIESEVSGEMFNDLL